MLRVIDPSKPCLEMPEVLAYTYKYPLDPFQQHAVAAIHRGENVLVTAKTGSGKTLVGEYQIHYSLAQGKRVFYTTPIKSLSNQKFKDLKAIFPSVGILTGDIKFKPDAQVVVMTTEILRNMLYKRGTMTESLGLSSNISMDNVGAVIFDEVHYINNVERGKVWEETLILMPPSVQLILLSATMAAPEEFASWIGDLKQRVCVLISTLYRVVPLTHYVLKDEAMIPIMDAKERYNDQAYTEWLRWLDGSAEAVDKYKQKVKDARAAGTEGGISGKATTNSFVHQLNKAVRLFESKELLPALFFVFSRKDCEKFAGKIEGTLIDSSDAAAVRHIIEFHLHRYEDVSRSAQYFALKDLMMRGIGYHHSGLLPLLKEIVEILFAKGLIKALFCTETFAVGINMPTKTAVFLDLTKYDDSSQGRRCLYTDEYIQMAGRAGRRGIDTLGTVVYLPQRKPVYADELKSMMKGSTRAIQSRMDFHYDFLMKTIASTELQWLDLMKDSYWFKQRMIVKEILKKELLSLEADLVEAVKKVPQADYDELMVRADLEKKVKESINAAKKDAQKALGAWNNAHFGPRWIEGWKLVPQIQRLRQAIVKKSADIDSCDKVDSLIEPRVQFLTQCQFIVDGKLGLKGILATEVNESHSLLTAELYHKESLTACSGEEILAILSAFINEKIAEDTVQTVGQLHVPDSVKNKLYMLDDMAQEFMLVEKDLGISDNGHWSVCLSWVEPVWRWLNGESSAQLCSDYGIYEGNLLRTVLRVGNIADEWIALATYCEHVEMVTKMTEVKERLVRGIAVTDSLYLRI
jgi:superfamily II RNA helicase